ncbi:MAG: cation transporter [Rhodobacter sp.]|nr:cation transporter [Rhodobacter sp.]
MPARLVGSILASRALSGKPDRGHFGATPANTYVPRWLLGVAALTQSFRYRVTRMDCASCAAKIEKAVTSAGVSSPKITTASQILTLDIDLKNARLDGVERAVSGTGHHLDRIPPGSVAQSDVPQHRAGDASVRAVWLFSCNDALGNAAVAFTATLVAITGASILRHWLIDWVNFADKAARMCCHLYA